ncbi:hypothetical protein HN011_004696 [Eciton burchellii]|nr:hypothetical protein HN011_004696 [Eciton burchellii]
MKQICSYANSVMDETVKQIEVKVLFFAKARELTGTKECKIYIPRELSSTNLLDKIIHTFKLESIRSQIILALNEEFVVPNSTLILSEKDEIAVIPPLSGGYVDNMEISKNFVKLQREELNVTEIMKLVTFSNCGAISNFVGITRDNFNNKKVIKLEYEAYESMALKEMLNICAKIRLQWNIEGIAIYHRIGEVPISEASIVIAVSSSHREESLRAVEYAINTLKASVPIWKKEVYETGETQWKENKECTWIDTLKQEDSQTTSNTNEEISNEIIIDPDTVQVRASREELNRRIQAFIERKRQQVNALNIQEFCCHSERSDDGNSCARVDAILIRRKDSKSHVKVHRVLNTWGPQTIDQSSLRRGLVNNANLNSINDHPILNERISASEHRMGINKPVPKDIYERLKNIEDRILHLESISPEYKQFWIADDSNLKSLSKSSQKRTYSMRELDSKLYELEDKYIKKLK